jgi:hypothetical protein
VGQERLGPSYFFISLVLGPLNSLLWYVPSSRYIWSSLLFFVSARTNKRHHHHQQVPPLLRSVGCPVWTGTGPYRSPVQLVQLQPGTGADRRPVPVCTRTGLHRNRYHRTPVSGAARSVRGPCGREFEGSAAQDVET